jgi:hypothetical protein
VSYFDRLRAAALEGSDRAYRAVWAISVSTLAVRVAMSMFAVNLACDLARTLLAR